MIQPVACPIDPEDQKNREKLENQYNPDLPIFCLRFIMSLCDFATLRHFLALLVPPCISPFRLFSLSLSHIGLSSVLRRSGERCTNGNPYRVTCTTMKPARRHTGSIHRRTGQFSFNLHGSVCSPD